jgi:hypothetical protein
MQTARSCGCVGKSGDPWEIRHSGSIPHPVGWGSIRGRANIQMAKRVRQGRRARPTERS